MDNFDCETRDSAYTTLERVLGVSRREMDAAFRDMPELVEGAGVDQGELLARLGGRTRLSAATKKVDGVCWFHLARVPDPTRFRVDGVLPLNLVLDSIWDFLHTLHQPPIARTEWDSFRAKMDVLDGHPARLYRSKSTASVHWGPFAILMLETALWPREVGTPDYQRDPKYLEIPEIVEDICCAFAAESGTDLAPAYRAATRPCVVKFVDPGPAARKEELITTALVHLFHRFHGYPLTMDCNTCLDKKSQPVSADRVLKIDCVE
jgi:hypothetical protein